jgi:hypothetical protein
VKAFVQFSSEATLLPELPAQPAPADREDEFFDELADELPNSEALEEGERQVASVAVEDILDCEVFGDPGLLPPHMRCAAHTLNLVATVDANKALEDKDTPFKTIYRRTMAKAQGLWNAQSRSVPVADMIHDVLHKRLVVPNATRKAVTFSQNLCAKKYCKCFSIKILFLHRR